MKGFKKLLRLKGSGKGKEEGGSAEELLRTKGPEEGKEDGGSAEKDLAADLNDSVCLHSSTGLLAPLSRDVSTWQANDVLVWLADEFKGAADLPKYLESFRHIGVRGADLLTANLNDIQHFGITDRVHVRRFQTALEGFSKRQKNLGVESMFEEMVQECEALRSKKPPYVLPHSMKTWSVVHVLYFLTLSEHTAKLEKLAELLVKNQTTGKMLLRKCEEIGEKQQMVMQGGTASVDVVEGILKKVVDDYNHNQKYLANEKKKQRGEESLPRFCGSMRRGLLLGKGNFGEVYLVKTARGTAVEKRLIYVPHPRKDKESSPKPQSQGTSQTRNKGILTSASESTPESETNGTLKAGTKGTPVSDNKTAPESGIEEIQKSGTKDTLESLTSDATYEARMMRLVQGTGVVRLLGVVEYTNQPPSLILEFMCNKSLLNEIGSAAGNSPDSIFNNQYEGNVAQADQGVNNPVLLQMVRIARDVALAIARVHENGVIHLDLAARNILLDAGKRPKIGDFGLAAIESDMVEQYELIQKIVADNKSLKGDLLEIKIKEGITNLEFGDSEEIIARRNNMRQIDRPIAWMPDWVVNCGSPPNPRLDHHTDIYSFGCVMYEMISGKAPHKNVSTEDLKKMKLAGRGNPPIPAGIDPIYARIMSACWAPYDKQPSMDHIAIQLSDLHKQLLKNVHQEDDAYRELKDMAPILFPAAPAEGGYSSMNKVIPKQKDRASLVRGTSTMPHKDRASLIKSSSIMISFPKMASGRVRFTFPESLDINDVGKLYEYRDEGMGKERLVSALRGAFSAKDAGMIANYMSCITVEISTLQVQVLVTCLEYLEQLAQDEHIDTDRSELQICGQVMAVAQSAEILMTESSPTNEQRVQLVKLLAAALGAVGALLSSSVQNYEEYDEEEAYLASHLSNFTRTAMQTLTSEASLMEKCALVIGALSTFDANFDDTAGGAATLLQRVISTHGRNVDVVTACAKALKKFPLRTLCDVGVVGAAAGPTNHAPAAGTERYDTVRVVFTAVSPHASNPEMGISEEVVESCLNALFHVCSSVGDEEEWFETFFFNVTAADMEMLFLALSSFPDNFRIQESVIGLLACIVGSGAGLEQVDNTSKYKSAVVIVPPVLPAAGRMATLLRCDPGFSLLLNAMDRFAVDDNSLLDSCRKRGPRKQGISVSRGMYARTSTRSGVSTKTKGVDSSASVSAKTGPKRSEVTGNGAPSLIRILQYYMTDQELFEGLLVDKEGEQLTAASLQRGVAMIIGSACNFSKEVQQQIAEHNFHVLILHAFQTFPRNNLLFQAGCHALFSTCRGNRLQQRRLHDLNILNNLCNALNSHQSVWEVADAAICVITGLLEPVNKRKCTNSAEMTSTDSYQVAQLLTGTTNNNSVLAWICRAVAQFQIAPECHQLTCNFLRLLSSLLFWLPDLLLKWQHSLVNLDDGVAVLYHIFTELLENEESSNQGPSSSMKVNLFDFVRLSLEFHLSACHVVGAGLALLSTTVQSQLSDERIPFGEELPYSTNKNLTVLRGIFLEKDLLNVLLQGSTVRGEDHRGNRVDAPTTDIVRIRHTFWLALVFISERRKVNEMNQGPAMRIAADMAIKKFVEWAIDVVELYPRCYSLQCLAIKFLAWMEHHGHFQSREKKLKELQSLLPAVRARLPGEFMSLDEEGYDTSMFGKSIDAFGKLHEHVDRLMLLLDIHLKSSAVEEVLPTWDGRCSPYAVRVVGFETEEDPTTLHRYNTYVIEVVWNSELVWTIPKRFSFYTDLQAKIMEEFSGMDVVRDVLVKPAKWVMSSRSLESKQECREMLDKWMQALITTRAVLFSETMLSFIEAYGHVPSGQIRRPFALPDSERPVRQAHPVTCVVNDVVNGLYFVGCGVVQNALMKMFTKVAVRGTVAVFDHHSSAGMGRPPLATLQFSVGVIKLAWDPSSRSLCVGLATGPIILYELSPAAPYTLTYLCEINSHTHPICFLEFDHASRVLYSASQGGLIEAFDTVDGKVISQVAVKSGTQVTAVVVVADMQWIVCGTNTSSLLIYDMTTTLSVQLAVYSIPSSSPTSVVTAVAFVEETHFLYVAIDHAIHLLKMPFTAQELDNQPWKWTSPLVLRVNMRITQLQPILNGKYLAATCGSEGSVFVYAMTKRVPIILPKKDKNKDGKNGTADSDEEEKKTEDKSVITATQQQATWQQAVHFSNFDLRVWFQALGVNSREARTRGALLKLMTKTTIRSQGQVIQVSAEDIAKALMPIEPSLDVLFAHHRRNPRDANVAITALEYLDSIRAFALGCSDGSVQLWSLTDFMPVATAADKSYLVAHFAVPVPPVKGSASTSGRRLQM